MTEKPSRKGKKRGTLIVKRIQRICEVCGKIREYLPSEITQREVRAGRQIRYCSKACDKIGRFRGRKILVPCTVCGCLRLHRLDLLERFPRKKPCCSQACSAIVRRKDNSKWQDKDYIRQYNKKYRENNKEILKLKAQRWVFQNKPKVLSIKKRYRDTHKDKIIALSEARRASCKGHDFRGLHWKLIKEIASFKCVSCGSEESKQRLEPDHVIPLKLGGGHHWLNIQPLCRACNSKKRIKTDDFRTEEFKRVLAEKLAFYGIEIRET